MGVQQKRMKGEKQGVAGKKGKEKGLLGGEVW